MDKTTHEIRISNWRSIIEQCQARPAGQSAKQWLADNGNLLEITFCVFDKENLNICAHQAGCSSSCNACNAGIGHTVCCLC